MRSYEEKLLGNNVKIIDFAIKTSIFVKMNLLMC